MCQQRAKDDATVDIKSPATLHGSMEMAQRVRARALQAGGPGFKSQAHTKSQGLVRSRRHRRPRAPIEAEQR